MRKGGIIIFLIYLFFGIYLINVAFNFITLPGFLTNFNNWIIFVGGILIIVGGINFLRARRERYLLRARRERY